MSFYKYLSAERAIDVLRKRLIRFTQPGAFNDPFECKPFIQSLTAGISESIIFPSFDSERVRDLARQKFADFKRNNRGVPIPKNLERTVINCFAKGFASLSGQPIKQLFEDNDAIELFRNVVPVGLDVSIGILSLAKRADNHLMWSHYSQNHSGVVIEFNEKHPYFIPSPTQVKKTGPFILEEVNYSVERPERPVFNSFEDFGRSDSYFTKSGEWLYENEWRMIRPLKFAQEIRVKRDDGSCTMCGAEKSKYLMMRKRKARRSSDIKFIEEVLRHEPEKYIYLFSIPPKAITSIILGCNISPSNETKIVRFLSRSKQYSHVRKYRAELDERKFKLNIVHWKPRTSSRFA